MTQTPGGFTWYSDDRALEMRKGPPATLAEFGAITVWCVGTGSVEARWMRADGVWHSYASTDANSAIEGLANYVRDQWPKYASTQAEAQQADTEASTK